MKRKFPVLLAALVGVGSGVGSLLAGGGVASAGGNPPPTTPGWKVTKVVSGLNGPRGLAVDRRGNLYVAEAGRYFPIGKTQTGASHTGRVDKISFTRGTATVKWSVAFDSLYDKAEGSPEALGPAGVSVLGGRVLVLLSGSRNEILKANPKLRIPQIGHLYSLSRATGRRALVTDVGDQEYAWGALHKKLWKELPDSNPNDVLVVPGKHGKPARTFVVDAGANTLGEIMPDGRLRVIAYIPNDRLRDSTPTCVTQGPDGALYVGTLDLVDNLTFGPGQSFVYRINPNTHQNFRTAAHLWAKGLTTVFGCTFDRHGNFWATEMFYPNGAKGVPGDVVRIPFRHPSSIEHIGLGSIPEPGGIVQGPGGAMYVAVNSPDVTPGSGGVVKLSRT